MAHFSLLFLDFCSLFPNHNGEGILLDFYRWMRRNGIPRDRAEREVSAVMEMLRSLKRDP